MFDPNMEENKLIHTSIVGLILLGRAFKKKNESSITVEASILCQLREQVQRILYNRIWVHRYGKQ